MLAVLCLKLTSSCKLYTTICFFFLNMYGTLRGSCCPSFWNSLRSNLFHVQVAFLVHARTGSTSRLTDYARRHYISTLVVPYTQDGLTVHCKNPCRNPNDLSPSRAASTCTLPFLWYSPPEWKCFVVKIMLFVSTNHQYSLVFWPLRLVRSLCAMVRILSARSPGPWFSLPLPSTVYSLKLKCLYSQLPFIKPTSSLSEHL